MNAVIEGIPCGAITEAWGSDSSGRTTVLFSIMADTARRGEVCAVVDTTNSFDPVSAASAGVDLDRLLWVQCHGDAAKAFKAADLLVQAGGFRLVVLDLCDVPLRILRRIPLAWWYRFRRAVEHTPTAMLVLGPEANVKSCAALSMEMRFGKARWSGSMPGARLLRAMTYEISRRKPPRGEMARVEVKAVG
ncbi:MAG TPA: hypothetical protein VH744_12310 [Terriglobales bacterium]